MKIILQKLIVLFCSVSCCNFYVAAQSYSMTAGTILTCSGIFYDSGGSAGDYGASQNITETFTSSSGACLIFTFTTFLTQNGNDYLIIYDGPDNTSPVFGTYTGSTSPGTIVSSGSSLTFNFTSSVSGNKSGWAANISCGSCGTAYLLNNNSTINACSGLYYDSGGATGLYANNENFTQTVCSDSGDCVQFFFYAMDLASDDTLKIYDGASIASPLIGKYTNKVKPPTLLSSSGCLTFNFVSNNINVDTGFNAIIKCYKCPAVPDAT
ncbi:MAG: hypothetical protein LH473_02740, partial [Chitinophagales bacterium]|nr:hypothetical protein [Chitinophagales bacterium]